MSHDYGKNVRRKAQHQELLKEVRRLEAQAEKRRSNGMSYQRTAEKEEQAENGLDAMIARSKFEALCREAEAYENEARRIEQEARELERVTLLEAWV